MDLYFVVSVYFCAFETLEEDFLGFSFQKDLVLFVELQKFFVVCFVRIDWF